MIYQYSYETILGPVTFVEEDGTLLAISTHRSFEGMVQETSLIKEAHLQFSEYLKGERKEFDIPFRMKGTKFQKQVWTALCEIPYGETRSYKQIAEAIGNPKAVRAVGQQPESIVGVGSLSSSYRHQWPIGRICRRIGQEGVPAPFRESRLFT